MNFIYVGWRLEWPKKLFNGQKDQKTKTVHHNELIPEKEINKIENTAISLMLPNKQFGRNKS